MISAGTKQIGCVGYKDQNRDCEDSPCFFPVNL